MKPSVGLCMIVRDERDAIESCLESVLPVISNWTIVDTGSEDGTPDLIRRRLADVPGVLHHRKWVNFAHNRTEAIRLAADTADYHLFLDGDHVLHRSTRKPRLRADEYRLRLLGGFDMSLPILLKNGRDWCWRGAAHAGLCCDDGRPIVADTLDEWTIEAREDDRDRTDKFRQDAAALEADLDTRTIFYLAQTYRDLGHLREAADLYRLRIRLSAAHPEEVFWACYQEGCLRTEIDGIEVGESFLIEAFERRPTRAEPLYAIGRAWRQKARPNVALMYLERAAAIPYPADQLFILRNVYEWAVELEICHCLNDLGRSKEAEARLRPLLKLGEPCRTYALNTLRGM